MATKAELQEQIDELSGTLDAVVDILVDEDVDALDRIDLALERMNTEVVEGEEDDWDEEDD